MTNLEKLKQNLETIEEGLFDKFVEECEAQSRNSLWTSNVDNPHYILGAFIWEGSTYGDDYWMKIDKAYSDLIKKQRIENQ